MLIVDTVRGIKNRYNLVEDECTRFCQRCPSTVDLRRRQGRTQTWPVEYLHTR